MRNYWVRILMGAFGIFAVGMIGVSLVRGGLAKVHRVVEGQGPITIPLGLIPFVIGGERLGNLDRVSLLRDSPTRVTEVQLSVDLSDSLLAQGLSECRLAANLEGNSRQPGLNIKVGRNGKGAFYCLAGDSTPPDVVEYGEATLNPGAVQVPLYLPVDLVGELQRLDFGTDSTPPSDSAADAIAQRQADSIQAAVAREAGDLGRRGDSIRGAMTKFADSIRAEARRRMAEAAAQQ
jgi:hypothetical protein